MKSIYPVVSLEKQGLPHGNPVPAPWLSLNALPGQALAQKKSEPCGQRAIQSPIGCHVSVHGAERRSDGCIWASARQPVSKQTL